MAIERMWEKLLYPGGDAIYPDREEWERRRRKIITEVGGLAAGFRTEMVMRGYKMIEEMTGGITFIQAWFLALTGKLPTKAEDRVLNAYFANAALADSRFWFNRTTRLAATVKSPPAACFAAGLLTKDGVIFSIGPAYNTTKFFYDTLKKVKSGEATLEEIVKDRISKRIIISGYGRVLARGADERNPSFMKVVKESGLDTGEHVKLAYEIEALLQKHKNPDLHINAAGIRCAIKLDMGLKPHQAAIFVTLAHFIGMVGNVAEAYERPPGEFLPLTSEDIEYTGPPLRRLPPASEKQTITHETENGRIVVMDSISFVEMANRGDVIVCGSHGGLPAAEHALHYRPAGVIFNDAGKGKENAGIEGLDILERANIPAATVAADSARIGDGMDSYNNGIVSDFNAIARGMGALEGIPAKEMALKMLP